MSFSALTPSVAPVLLGLGIGFLVAVLGIRRWFNRSAAGRERDLTDGLKRLALQSLLLGAALTLAGGKWLGDCLEGRTAAETIPAALWGLPLGMAAGVRWIWRRGER